MDEAKEGRNLAGPGEISDDDIYEAMKQTDGYVDITPADVKQIFLLAYDFARRRLLTSARAAEIMTSPAITVPEDMPLTGVASVMAERGISGLPVIGKDGRVAGVISEKDFLRHMGGHGRRNVMSVIAECISGQVCLASPLRKKKASDIMTSPPVTADENETVVRIMEIFESRGINRIPVVGQGEKLLGIITRSDVMRVRLMHSGRG